MDLLNTIRDWTKNQAIGTIDLDGVENSMQRIKNDPLLKNMEYRIEELLHNLAYTAMHERGKRVNIVINGGDGSGKTNFFNNYLKSFLFSTGIIKDNPKYIQKISYFDLTKLGNNDARVKEIIEDCESASENNILVLDGFSIKNTHAELISDLVKRMNRSEKFIHSVVALIGTMRANEEFIRFYNLDYFFPQKYRLTFERPDIDQLIDIFILYAKREGGYVVNENSKSVLRFYFKNLLTVKKAKNRLYNNGGTPFPPYERIYGYASEIPILFKSIVNSEKDTTPAIDKKDIESCDAYQKLTLERKLFITKRADSGS